MHTKNGIDSAVVLAMATVAMSLVAGTVSQGATRTWSGGNGNWDTDASWGGTEPVSGDLAQINNGDTVTVNQTGEIAGGLNLSGGSTVQVDAGDLTLDAVSQSYSLSVNNGSLNVSGGAVTASGVVNNYLNGSGVINVSAGSFTHTAANLRFGDGATIGTLTVSGSGSWSSGNLYMVGTGNINLTGSSAQISGVNLNNNAGTALNVNLTPDSGGINAIGCTGLNLTSTDTLNFNIGGYVGAKTVELFTYSGTLTGTFNTTNITRTGGGDLTPGSNPGGNPANLGENEYYLDYGSGSGSSVTLYYNVPRSATITVTTADGMVINGVGEYNEDAVNKNKNFSPTAAGGGNQQFHFLTLDTTTLMGILEASLGALASGEKYTILSASYSVGVSTDDGDLRTEYQTDGGVTVHAMTTAFNVDAATWNHSNTNTSTTWADGIVSSTDWNAAVITTGVDNTAYSTLFSGLGSTLQGWVDGEDNKGLSFVQSVVPDPGGQLTWTDSNANTVLTIVAEAGPPKGMVLVIR